MEKTVKTATGSVRASESSKPTNLWLGASSSRINKSCVAFGGVDVSCFFQKKYLINNFFIFFIILIY
jgi:hypothetical protein